MGADAGAGTRTCGGLRSAGRGESHGHLSHRRIHAVRRRSGRAVPGHPGSRGRRHRRRCRAGRDQREEGRPRHSALYAGMPAMHTPECRQCPSCLSRKTNLSPAIRATQGQGVMPDGTSRFSLGGKPIHHYMGTSTFSNFIVLPEIAVAKIREDAPFDKVCYIGCGVTTGIGAVINTAKVEQGAKAIVFGLGGIGLNVLQGLRLAGADMIIGVDINNDRQAWGERFGMTHFVNPKKLGKDLVPHLVNMTKSDADQIGGAEYTFDCTGNVTVMRQALEACHRGWGQSIIIGVAPAGAEISTRPFQLVTGRVWKGTAFGGARGRTDVPRIVDWYMQGKIEIDPMITHTMPLAEINTAFDLMHAGES